jgi:hypothetical protein
LTGTNPLRLFNSVLRSLKFLRSRKQVLLRFKVDVKRLSLPDRRSLPERLPFGLFMVDLLYAIRVRPETG